MIARALYLSNDQIIRKSYFPSNYNVRLIIKTYYSWKIPMIQSFPYELLEENSVYVRIDAYFIFILISHK